MKNSIFVGTNTPITVNVNGFIPLRTILHRKNGNNKSEIDAAGDAITIQTSNCARPRYDAIASITFTAATAGDVSISFYVNGVLIPYTTKTETITTASTEYRTLTIPCAILTNRCALNTITLVNTGAVGITVTNATINVVEQ